MTPFQPAKLVNVRPREFIAACMRTGMTRRDAKLDYRRLMNQKVWKNDLYQVNVDEVADGWTHLSVKRIDKAPARDWRHFQRIKTELCGPEREAIELYPAESRLVDTANQYHLWVLPPGLRMPIGYDFGRKVDDGGDFPGVVQRPPDPYTCRLCGQRIDDGKACGCGAR